MEKLCLWIGRVNIAQVSILPKFTYRFNAISIKITGFFVDIYMPVIKFISNGTAKGKGNKITTTIFKRKNKFG